MKVDRPAFYGVVTILVAFLLVTSSLALYYYEKDQTDMNQEHYYIGVLDTALGRYGALSGNYNASLSGYNSTLRLLTAALSNLDTNVSAYRDAAVALPALWKSYQTLAGFQGRSVPTYSVHLMVYFGNHTRTWYNQTRVEPGWNGYVATLVLLKGAVDATWYPSFGAHFVTAIGEVGTNSTDGWFLWGHSSGGWNDSVPGIDEVPINNGTVLAWTLCSYDQVTYQPMCPQDAGV